MVAEAAVVGFPHDIKGQLISEHNFFFLLHIWLKTKHEIIPTQLPLKRVGPNKRVGLISYANFLTLFQLGRDNFYHRNSISRDTA